MMWFWVLFLFCLLWAFCQRQFSFQSLCSAFQVHPAWTSLGTGRGSQSHCCTNIIFMPVHVWGEPKSSKQLCGAVFLSSSLIISPVLFGSLNSLFRSFGSRLSTSMVMTYLRPSRRIERKKPTWSHPIGTIVPLSERFPSISFGSWKPLFLSTLVITIATLATHWVLREWRKREKPHGFFSLEF